MLAQQPVEGFSFVDVQSEGKNKKYLLYYNSNIYRPIYTSKYIIYVLKHELSTIYCTCPGEFAWRSLSIARPLLSKNWLEPFQNPLENDTTTHDK